MVGVHPCVMQAGWGTMHGTRDQGRVLSMEPEPRGCTETACRARWGRGLWETAGAMGRGLHACRALPASSLAPCSPSHAPPPTCTVGPDQCKEPQEAKEGETCSQQDGDWDNCPNRIRQACGYWATKGQLRTPWPHAELRWDEATPAICPHCSGVMETIEFERRLESLRKSASAAAVPKQVRVCPPWLS